MAERQGFEPWVPVKAHTLSKRARSTTPTSLQVSKAEGQGFEPWVPRRVHRFSKPARSNTPASLLWSLKDE